MHQSNTVEIHGTSSDCMPLSLMREGGVCRVGAVRGNDDTKHHITSLGFVEGAVVEIISKPVSYTHLTLPTTERV